MGCSPRGPAAALLHDLYCIDYDKERNTTALFFSLWHLYVCNGEITFFIHLFSPSWVDVYEWVLKLIHHFSLAHISQMVKESVNCDKPQCWKINLLEEMDKTTIPSAGREIDSRWMYSFRIKLLLSQTARSFFLSDKIESRDQTKPAKQMLWNSVEDIIIQHVLLMLSLSSRLISPHSFSKM